MRERISIAAFSATFAYIILVFTGIILDLSLELILVKGIIGLFLIGISLFLLLAFLENNLADVNEDVDDIQNSDLDNEKKLGENPEEEFSPLNLTVLESNTSEKDE